MVADRFSFNVRLVSVLMDPVAHPEVWRLSVQLTESTGTPAITMGPVVTVALGCIGAGSELAFDQITHQLQETLRAAIKSSLEGTAFRIQNPTQAAIVDKLKETWTPVGLPKEFYDGPPGKPYEEPMAPKPPFELHQRVAWLEDTGVISHGEVVHIATVPVGEVPIIKLFLDDDLNVDCLEGEIAPLLCSVCGEPQFHTDSGPVCRNGHGGAPCREPVFK